MVLFFPLLPFYDFHLNKDVGLFVKYFSKFYFKDAEILKVGNKESREYKNAFFPVKDLFLCPRIYTENYTPTHYQLKCIIKSFLYLKKNKDITHVMFFHITYYSVYFSLLIKLLLKHIKIYIKLDITVDGSETLVSNLKGKHGFGKYIKRWLFPRIDLISTETSASHESLLSSPWLKNMQLIPNGLDDDFLYINPELLHEKENIIITVGRLGSYQKNTELILSILKEIDLKDWRILLIGPIEHQETDFQADIDNFFNEYPFLISKVHFIGNISNKTILYEYYRKSRVFLFPSRFEASSLALLEAAAFGNYIIATDVGSSKDLTNNGQCGFICPESNVLQQNDDKIKTAIKEQLALIIDNKIDINKQIEKQSLFIKENFMMSKIIKNPALKIWAGTKN
jgi:glycosyltransferase involved in cell wall biosynthesis